MPYRQLESRYLIPDNNTTIYRYFDEFKANWLFENSSIYFSRVDEFEKYNEMLFSFCDRDWFKRRNDTDSISIYEDFKKRTYISCWTDDRIESKFLWDNYSKDKNSIAIKSTVEKLKQEFNNAKEDIYISKIHYFDPITEPLGLFNGIRMFSRKIKHFIRENEIRAIIQLNEDTELPKHLEIKINLPDLIEEIILCPNASSEYASHIEFLAEKNNVKNRVS